MKILLMASNRWWTGSADPTLSLAVGLRERGHEVSLACARGDRFEVKARDVGITPRPELCLDPRAPLRTIQDVRTLRQILGKEGVQILHANHSHDHWLAAMAARRMPARIVRTFHALRAVRQGPLYRALYRARCHAAVAVTRAIEARCLDAGIPRERCVRIGSSVDLTRFSSEVSGTTIRDEFNLGRAPVVGTVSRLAPNRGHELLLRAFQTVAQTLPDARLLIVGKGENRSALEALRSELGLARIVVFAGYRDHDLPEALAATDLFTLLGTGSEESGRAALEAMASGKPVVGRRLGALPEIIRHEETGWLLEGEDAEELAAVLTMLLKDRDRARAMGRLGRGVVETEHSPAARVRRVEALYRSLIDE